MPSNKPYGHLFSRILIFHKFLKDVDGFARLLQYSCYTVCRDIERRIFQQQEADYGLCVTLYACDQAQQKRWLFLANSPASSSQDGVLPSQIEMTKPDRQSASQPTNQTGISRPTFSYQTPGRLATSHSLPFLPHNQPTTSCHGAASPSLSRPEVITGNSAAENQTFMGVMLSKTSRYQE